MATRSLFHPSAFTAALIAAGLMFGGSAYAQSMDSPAPSMHSDGIGAAASDTIITSKVKSKFMADERLKHSDISVNTANGIVTLTGTASSTEASATAASVASNVEGVRSVNDQLKPSSMTATEAKVDQAEATTKRVASDSWITTKVKSEIMADSVSKGFEVGVKTKHGIVSLHGTLADQRAIDHVTDITGKVKGVKSVNTDALKIAAT